MVVRWFGSYRKIILAFLSVIICGIFVYVIYCSYVLLNGRHELQEAIDEADAIDPGWRMADLEKSRGSIPDDENSALQVQKAESLIPQDWGKPTEKQSLGATGENSESAVMIKRSLIEARKLAGFQNGRYPFDRSMVPLMNRSLTDKAQRVAWLLDWDARKLNKQGKTHEAVTSCRAILAAGRSIGDEPSIFSQILRLRIRNLAVRSMERALAEGEVSEDALRELQIELLTEEAHPLLLIMIRAERALWHESLQSCENGDFPFEQLVSSGSGAPFDPASISRLFLPDSHAWIIRYFNNLVQVAMGPQGKQIEKMGILAETITCAPAQTKLIFADQPGFYLRQADNILASRGLLLCAATALACERFRLKNNRWPSSLVELVPEYLREPPRDANDATPLELQVLRDKIIIHTRRFQENDKTDAVAKENSASEQCQASFTLLNPSKRGKNQLNENGNENIPME